VFCPKHGWIQEGIHDKEVALEQPLRLSIKEVPEEHEEQEMSLEGKESEMLYEIEKPETFPMPEEEQWETDLSDKRELKTADLLIGRVNVVRNKSTSISIIFTVIFIVLLLSSTLGYLAWKNSSSESLRIKSLRALVQKEGLTMQVQSQASTTPQESVLVERSTEEVKSVTSVPPQEAVPQSGNAEPTEKTKVKPSQFQKPSHEIFTVQVGAFTDVFYAKSLKKRLDKKGYKIYITSSNSKEGKLYKVWTGKFSTRQKAESLAAKITKTESIQAFVILWKKQ
jgi:cell division septation protein DedD